MMRNRLKSFLTIRTASQKYMAALDVNEDMLEEYGEDALAADADIGKIKER